MTKKANIKLWESNAFRSVSLYESLISTKKKRYTISIMITYILLNGDRKERERDNKIGQFVGYETKSTIIRRDEKDQYEYRLIDFVDGL